MGETWPKIRIIHVRRYTSIFEVLIELSGNKSRGKGHQNQNDDNALFAMMLLDDIPYPAPFGPGIKKKYQIRAEQNPIQILTGMSKNMLLI